jgi:hypothetical protein
VITFSYYYRIVSYSTNSHIGGATRLRNPYVPPATRRNPLAGVTHAVYARALIIF